MQIFKFGGSSIKDSKSIHNMVKIIRQYGKRPLIVVVSAIGKTTHKLEILADLAAQGKPFQREFRELKNNHRIIAQELMGNLPENYLQWEHSLSEWCEKIKGHDSLWAYDQVMCHGELMSASIIYAYLSQEMKCGWLDAREVIRTDQYFTEANVDWVVTESQVINRLKSEKHIIITQGFIGSDAEGNSTTLSKEGSDFTGAILAYCLSAESLTVWKDVAGILNADPRRMEHTEKYDRLSYREMTEMTYYGARVIHPKTLKPLAQRNIPLIVKSFVEPDQEGTFISSENTKKTVPCFVFKDNQLLVTTAVKDHNFMNEQKLGMILQVLDLLNIKINLMQNSALTFSFCMDNKEFKAKRIKALLTRDFVLSFEAPLNLATIKNYRPDSFNMLPKDRVVLMEQKTASNYQALYR